VILHKICYTARSRRNYNAKNRNSYNFISAVFFTLLLTSYLYFGKLLLLFRHHFLYLFAAFELIFIKYLIIDLKLCAVIRSRFRISIRLVSILYSAFAFIYILRYIFLRSYRRCFSELSLAIRTFI
jgi:hypothetical protein